MKRLNNSPITSEQAVSVVVGALLIVSIMMIAAVQYQNNVIPAQERQTDYQHNREVRSQLHHLRSNIIATSSSGQLRTTPVNVGANYEQRFIFGFLPAVISPDSAGTLNMYNVSANRGQYITITGAQGRGGASNYWQATSTYEYSTSFLNYSIDYARYQNPPKVYYENTVLYEKIPQDGNSVNYAVQSKQTLIQGKNINLVTVSGDVSTTTTRTVNIQTQPVSAPSQTIVIKSPPPSEGGPLTIRIPTNAPQSMWCDIPQCGGGDGAGLLNNQMKSQGGYIADFTAGPGYIELEFVAQETFTLQLSRVHLQSQQDQSVTPQVNAKYVAWRGSDKITFRENTRHTITAQVRDRYNNPVPGVDTNATAFEADDQDDCIGDFVSGTLGGIAGCPNVRQPGHRTSGDNGEVTFFYDTPQVDDDTRINLQVTLANNNNSPSLAEPTFALGPQGTYASPVEPNPPKTSDTATINVNELGSGEIYFSHNTESQINDSRTFRIIDASLNSSHIIKGKSVRLKIVAVNTGISTTSPTVLSPTITPSVDHTITPKPYSFRLEPGEQFRFAYNIQINETGTYTITLDNTNISKEVQVHAKSSTVYDGDIQTAVERQSIAKVVTSYKDEIESSENPAYNQNIPPVVQGPNGTFQNDAVGIVYDFGDAQNAQDGASLTLEGNESLDSMEVGLAFENVPQQAHYTMQLTFEVEGSEPVQMQVVRRDGSVIDPQTKYMLGANKPRQTKYFPLSKEESKYIQNHKNIYLVFTSEGAPIVDIGYMQAISSNYILDTTSTNVSFVDFTVTDITGTQTNKFDVFEPIYISVTKKNTGTTVVERNVILEQDGSPIDSQTVTLNPGEQQTVTFIKYRPTGVYTFSSRGYGATTVEVGNPAGSTNRAPIPRITSNAPEILNKYVPSGSTAADDRYETFQLNASRSYDPNGDPLTYEWRINGATAATGPVLDGSNFNSNGIYEVTLIVDDGQTRSAVRKQVAINSIDPTSLFKVNPRPIPSGTTAQFNASQALDQDGNIQQYIWKIDGTTVATQTDPWYSHKFSSTGFHEISLTTVDDDGNRNTRTSTVEVFTADVYASFTYNPDSPMVQEQVTFNASGSDATNSTITQYEWQRGDGTVLGTGKTLTKEFNTQGDISVTLIVETSDGKTASITKTITVDPPFNAVAQADPDSTIPGETVYFNAYGTNDPYGMIEQYKWKLGDGTTINGQEAFHEYANPGTYNVTLTATGNGYTSTDTITVQVKENKPVAIAQFSKTVFLSQSLSVYGDDSYHPGGTITYYNWNMDNGETQSTANVVGYNYTQPTINSDGTRHRQPYNVTLTVTGEYGNTDTDSVEIEVENRGPRSQMGPNKTVNNKNIFIYAGETVYFNGSESYHIEAPIGQIQSYQYKLNGSAVYTGSDWQRTFNKPANYTINLTVTDQFSESDSQVRYVVVYDSPTARLTVNPSTAGTGETVTFDASSSTPGGPSGTTITEYQWDFNNDGTIDQTTTDAITSYSYTTSGTYNATVTIVNSDGKQDSTNATVTITQDTVANQKYIVINNPTSKSANNYQVDINLTREANMTSDYRTVRFYQNGNSLDYHRVSYNSNQGNFVVELNQITSDGAIIKATWGDTSLNTASDPEATYVVWDYQYANHGMNDGSFYGSAYDVGSDYARLTEAVDGQQGSLRYGSHNVGLIARYDWRVRDGSGADSVNFVTYNNGNYFEHEDPHGNGIHFAVNDHDDCVTVNWYGQCDTGSSYNYNEDHQWHQATAKISQSGGRYYDYYFNSNADSAPTLTGTIYADGIGNQFGFSGRTGGLNNYHEVKDIMVRKYLGAKMQTYSFSGQYIDNYERGNMNPYTVSDASFFHVSSSQSTDGLYSLAAEISSGGQTAYSTSGLNHYPTRGDYWTMKMQFEGEMSWGQYYGTRFTVGWAGSANDPAYRFRIDGRNNQLELYKNNNLVDTAPVYWNNHDSGTLRFHVDYDAYGDGMIRVHVFDNQYNKIATVDMYDPNGPTGGTQLYFGLVGENNYDGTIYVDEIKTQDPIAWTDGFEDAGLANWQGTGEWYIDNGGVAVEAQSSWGSDSAMSNPNFEMDTSNGVYMQMDSYVGGTWANYNYMSLLTSSGSNIHMIGMAHDDYNGRNGVILARGGDGYRRIDHRAIYGYNWYTVYNNYTRTNDGQCKFGRKNVNTYYENGCTLVTDKAQTIQLSGWSHNDGDRWQDLYIRRITSEQTAGSGSSLPTTIYSTDFNSGTDGWTTETGNIQADSGWLDAGCSYYAQTNYFTRTFNDRNSQADSIYYEIRVAAIDSWDGEVMRIQIQDDSGWHTVEQVYPHYTDRYGSNSYDCYYSFIGDTFTFSGNFNVDGQVRAIRVYGGLNQDDHDESIGIDYVTIERR